MMFGVNEAHQWPKTLFSPDTCQPRIKSPAIADSACWRVGFLQLERIINLIARVDVRLFGPPQRTKDGMSAEGTRQVKCRKFMEFA